MSENDELRELLEQYRYYLTENNMLATHAVHDAIINLFNARPSPEDSQGGWIAVSERLPEDNCEVLAFFGNNYRENMGDFYDVEFIREGQWKTLDGEDENNIAVTHWIPLPDPPTTEAGEGNNG